MNKKVLCIVYFFPPIAGSGVQRSLKFIKYLPEFNYIPIVETVKEGHNFAYDEGLLDEVPECVKIYRSNSGETLWLRNIIEKLSKLRRTKNINTTSINDEKAASASENKVSLKARIFNYIDLNFFIPDSKIRWYKSAVKDIRKILGEEKIDIIYSSSYPYTVHLIALEIKKRTNLPWVADFRDPWTENVFMTKGHSEKRKKKELLLEEEVMKYADAVIMVSEPATEIYKNKYPQYANKIKTITNGFDRQDFAKIAEVKEDKFTICYSGILTEGQDLQTLIMALEKLFDTYKEAKQRVKLKFIGLVIDQYKDMLMNSSIKDIVEMLPYMPHDDVIQHMKSAQVNLLILVDKEESRGVFSGKIFDYIGAEKPILGIMPDNGVASNLIMDNKIGKSFNHGEVDDVFQFIKEEYEKWLNNENTNTNSMEKCDEFDRKNLTKKLVDILQDIS